MFVLDNPDLREHAADDYRSLHAFGRSKLCSPLEEVTQPELTIVRRDILFRYKAAAQGMLLLQAREPLAPPRQSMAAPVHVLFFRLTELCN